MRAVAPGRVASTSRVVSPRSHALATRSAICATTPRLWVMNSIAMPCRSFRSASSPSTCAWMVTSSAVVGSSASSTAGSQASAIAIITRWRIPPEN